MKAAKKKMAQAFYLQHPRDLQRCENFRRSYCNRGAKCKLLHSELDRETKFLEDRKTYVEKTLTRVRLVPNPEFQEKEINSFAVSDAVVDSEGWLKLTANLDTGAAVTAIPSELKKVLQLKTNAATIVNYKTASGELLSDEGGTTLVGYNEEGKGCTVDGRLVGVHRLLVSGSAVAKKNFVAMDGNKGYILPKDGPIAEGMRNALNQLKAKFPKDAERMTELYEHKGIFCFDLWCKAAQDFKEQGTAEPLAAVEAGFSRQGNP